MTTSLRPLALSISIVVISLIMVVSISSKGLFADPTPQLINDEFTNKYVTIYLSNTDNGTGQILTQAKLITVGGRLMLVGIGADTGDEDNWTAGVTVGVAWDSVEFYYAMTKEQFSEMVKQNDN